jgi:Leucine-rich repeat (LRR) protein
MSLPLVTSHTSQLPAEIPVPELPSYESLEHTLDAWIEEDFIQWEEKLPRDDQSDYPYSHLSSADVQNMEVEVKIKVLDEFIEKTKTLYLHDFCIQSIPPVVALHHLKTLSLSSIPIETLPRELTELSHLENLKLDHLAIRHIPHWIADCTFLKRLMISHNPLSTLPPLPLSLRHLSIDSNQFCEFPQAILKIVKLKTLYFSQRGSISIPEDIDQLSDLEHLNLKENQLFELPHSIGNLRKLTHLFLSGNQLRSLPQSFSRLDRLTVLHVSHNPDLTDIPLPFWTRENFTLVYENTDLTSPYKRVRAE